EMLVGKNPFEDVPADDLLHHIRQPSLPPIRTVDPSVPPGVAAVVDRALSPEPFRRFATAEEMRARLSACLSEMAPDVGPEALSRFLVHLFRAEYERERELLARVAAREEAISFDPHRETEVVTVTAESPSGPHQATTEVISGNISYPWPRRPYLPEEYLAYARVPAPPEPPRRRRTWVAVAAAVPAAALRGGILWKIAAPPREAAASMVEAASRPPEPEAAPAAPPAPAPQPAVAEPRALETPTVASQVASPRTARPETTTAPRRPSRTVVVPQPPKDDAEAARTQLLSRWRALRERYQRLVKVHGEERVGTIVAQMVQAAQTSVDRSIDQPEEYDALEAQLDALGEIVAPRRARPAGGVRCTGSAARRAGRDRRGAREGAALNSSRFHTMRRGILIILSSLAALCALPAAAGPRERVAVVVSQAVGVGPLADHLGNLAAEHLGQGTAKVIGPGEAARLLRERGGPAPESCGSDAACLREIARALEADWVVALGVG